MSVTKGEGAPLLRAMAQFALAERDGTVVAALPSSRTYIGFSRGKVSVVLREPTDLPIGALLVQAQVCGADDVRLALDRALAENLPLLAVLLRENHVNTDAARLILRRQALQRIVQASRTHDATIQQTDSTVEGDPPVALALDRFSPLLQLARERYGDGRAREVLAPLVTSLRAVENPPLTLADLALDAEEARLANDLITRGYAALSDETIMRRGGHLAVLLWALGILQGTDTTSRPITRPSSAPGIATAPRPITRPTSGTGITAPTRPTTAPQGQLAAAVSTAVSTAAANASSNATNPAAPGTQNLANQPDVAAFLEKVQAALARRAATLSGIPNLGEPWPESVPTAARVTDVPLVEPINAAHLAHRSCRITWKDTADTITADFSRGYLSAITFSRIDPDRCLGRLLVSMGKLREDKLEEVAKKAAASGILIGEALVEAALLVRAELAAALRFQAEARLEFMCAQHVGDWTLEDIAPTPNDPLRLDPSRAIFRAAANRVTPEVVGKRLREALGSYPSNVTPLPERARKVGLDSRIMRLIEGCIDGNRGLSDLERMSPVVRSRTGNAVYALYLVGAVTLRFEAGHAAAENDAYDRLSREAVRMEGQNAFEALGLHWLTDQSAVDAAIRRYRDLYGPTAGERPMSPRCAALCDRILSRAETAYAAIMTGDRRRAERAALYDMNELRTLADIHFDQGLHILLMRGDFREAKPYFEQLLDLIPGHPLYTAGEACALVLEGRFSEAERLFQRAASAGASTPGMDRVKAAYERFRGQMAKGTSA